MFERREKPRVFALPPGVDFPFALVQGLISRHRGLPPEDLARVRLIVNTRRMQRRIKALFDAEGALLLPRIQLVTDLSAEAAQDAGDPPVSPLRRRLELARLIAALIEKEPDIAPRAAIFDLADSLAALLDEMQGEDVDPEALKRLDVSDASGHWARSLGFIGIVQDYLEGAPGLDGEAMQRLAVQTLIERWSDTPPTDPIIVAGSTGSRGTTALLMDAVARLPQGAIVLPGFDDAMPAHGWSDLGDALTAEDHPQFRFRALMGRLGLNRYDIDPWHEAKPPSPARNKMVSLALRPAPVTDTWLTEGRALAPLEPATSGMTLLEAPSPRAEALAIALRLRFAAENGEVAALITPDRMLTRQVEAALDRWGIAADDSAGRPLPLTAPGRFLRHVADLFGQRLAIAPLLAVLKHPLCNTGGDARGQHLLWTRELELHLRKNGPPFPQQDDLVAWADRGAPDPGRVEWAKWVGGLVCGLSETDLSSLEARVEAHVTLAEALAAGPGQTGSGALWDEAAGREALAVANELRRDAPFGGDLSAGDYARLLSSVLSKVEVRTPDDVYPNIMIWGTLEARVQGADLVILGGLNDGIWPASPNPDPWLNRKMRLESGLLLPERRIGLSAHDFQQAIAAPAVWLSRSMRDDEAETVPSRWLNRLTNLLGGLKEDGGDEALQQMRKRGDEWLSRAALLDKTADKVAPAHRPSPKPPTAARPQKLSVTEIKTLIRDPYAIYAKRVLKLRAVPPLRPSADAPMRGTAMHSVFERFVRETPAPDIDRAHQALMAIADEVLHEQAPWPTARRLWRAKLERVADWFLQGEARRRMDAGPAKLEARGALTLTDPPFVLTATADRIDLSAQGEIDLYDYKTGKPPTAKEQAAFDKQLLLEAAMLEQGCFDGMDPAPVRRAQYIGVGSSPEVVDAPLDDVPAARVLAEFSTLIQAYTTKGQGFTARRAVAKERFEGDYDHLSRFGEWDTSMQAVPEVLK